MFHPLHLSILLYCVAGDNLQILNIHGKGGPAPCAKTCVGTTAELRTPWKPVVNRYSTMQPMIMTTVDISGCGFVGSPVVTTSLHGTNELDDQNLNWLAALVTGQSSVVNLSKNSFQVYLYGFHGRVGKVVPFTTTFGKLFDVHWMAFGYMC